MMGTWEQAPAGQTHLASGPEMGWRSQSPPRIHNPAVNVHDICTVPAGTSVPAVQTATSRSSARSADRQTHPPQRSRTDRGVSGACGPSAPGTGLSGSQKHKLRQRRTLPVSPVGAGLCWEDSPAPRVPAQQDGQFAVPGQPGPTPGTPGPLSPRAAVPPGCHQPPHRARALGELLPLAVTSASST